MYPIADLSNICHTYQYMDVIYVDQVFIEQIEPYANSQETLIPKTLTNLNENEKPWIWNHT